MNNLFVVRQVWVHEACKKCLTRLGNMRDMLGLLVRAFPVMEKFMTKMQSSYQIPAIALCSILYFFKSDPAASLQGNPRAPLVRGKDAMAP